jgi:hypothetical protein
MASPACPCYSGRRCLLPRSARPECAPPDACATLPGNEAMNPPHDDADVASATTGGNTGHSPNLRPWRVGESGNPAGRSISLVNLALEVRRATRGGRELVELQLAIARGEEILVPGRARGQRPNLDQRMAACAWLADRGWGKAREVIELAGEASPSQRLELLRRLSDSEREQLRGLLTRALERESATSVTEPAAALGPGPAPPAAERPARPDEAHC